MRKRFEVKLPKGNEGRGPYVVAAAVQTVLIIVFASVVTIPIIALARKVSKPQEERVEPVQLREPPVRRDAAPTPPRRDPPPVEPTRSVPPPTTIEPPTVAPPATVPVAVPPPVVGDTNPRVIGRGLIPQLAPRPPLTGVFNGVEPARAPTSLPRATGSPDSVMRTWITQYWDSVARAQALARGEPNPNDWTVIRGGGKFGVDSQFIYFGKFRLPTLVLAALPITQQANPSRSERTRILMDMRADIMYQAMRAQSQMEFDKAVKALRERTDKARAARRDSTRR
ncbi:MAG TPA: hypothetical protein VJR92_11920 [Gemmatimonadaceae bacterium]|nr:hypothetical protein [Gemmatimonadaceae bacterium]